MAARFRPMGLAVMLALAGCTPIPFKEQPLQTVQPGPPGPVAVNPNIKAPQLPASSKEEAIRVDIVGQKLLTANRQIGIRPFFTVVGAPMPELFHRNTEALFITEGLSRKCPNEGQLAAVLAYELGRIISEREALAPLQARQPDRLPPLESGVGGGADLTHEAELGKYEREHPRRRKAPPPPPDPLVLARIYLEKAGFTAQDLADVEPLLKEARATDGLERQLGAPARPTPEAGR